jgi:rubrerythrin
MKDFNNVDDILDFAIENEQKAIDFYIELANKNRNSSIRETFEKFSIEEAGHKARLIKIKDEKIFVLTREVIQDLKLTDYIENVKPTGDMSYQDALILAMKREKSAFKLYSNLASKASSKYLQDLFLQLAQEESKHKLMFELEYDEVILKDN